MSPSNINYAEVLALINAEYQTLATSNSSKDKASCFSAIIQLKQALALTAKPEIYTDIKGFIKYYISSLEEAAFHYDTVLFSVIERSIIVADNKAKLNLYTYALRILKAHGLETQAAECQNAINLINQQILKKENNISSFIHWFYLITTESVFSISISLLLSIIISTAILLPAYSSSLAIVKYQTQSYSQDYLINRLLNTLVLMTGLDDEVKIRPVNIFGVITMIIGKGIFFLIIGNILFKQFKSKFNLE